MAGMRKSGIGRDRWRNALAILPIFLLLSLPTARSIEGQSGIPDGQFHLSITLGGYSMVGVGYTHWIERHHALELTVFPFAYPSEGFPFGLRAGYAWVPSDEVWRAKLGGNATVLIRPGKSALERFTPILALTPGIQYDPDSDRSFRTDLWVSYYVREKVFAPTALEFLYGWNR